MLLLCLGFTASFRVFPNFALFSAIVDCCFVEEIGDLRAVKELLVISASITFVTESFLIGDVEPVDQSK